MKPKINVVWIILLGVILWQCTEDEEAPLPSPPATVVDFALDHQTLPKQGSPLSVNLTFNRAAATTGLVVVRIDGDAVYSQHFTTSPEAEEGVVILPIEKGQSSTHFTVSTVNDQEWTDDKHLSFFLDSPSSGFALGNKVNASLTLVDDEDTNPAELVATIEFAEDSAQVLESDTEVPTAAPEG
uniref:Uncharacterized protein n=1 Tax=Roseihalotalea indica TaxID=2867963 RepID=A0AA49JJ00_9BACT|nr:hypothetical protein K4G66_03245 [Tunicatimonas sp. TK19036]